MEKKTIFIKTSKGESEVSSMSGDMKRVMLLIDGISNFGNVIKRAPPSLRSDLPEIIQRLLDAELICDKAKENVGIKIVSPRTITVPIEAIGEDLDFTGMFKAPSAAELVAQDKKEKEFAALQAAAKKKAEAEAVAKARAEAEAIAKREAVGRQAAEAKARAEADARQRAEQEAARAKSQLEAAAKSRREAEELGRREAEAIRIKSEQEAARIKAELEAVARAKREAEERARKEAETAARVKAELEAAKAKAEAEAKALAEERTRIEAEERKRREEAEAARIKAQEEAAARAKAEEEKRIRQEAEALRIKLEKEAEAARLKAEEEAARVKAELEAAKAKAEAEAKALEEERVRIEAEERKRREEAEAARIKAQEEAAARAKAEEEKRLRQEAEALRIKLEKEAEAARLKAEEEAARVKAELEAAKAKAEAEAKALEEERVRIEAEERKRREEAEAARIKAQEEVAARAKAEEEERLRQEAEALRIKLEKEAEAARLKTEEDARAKARIEAAQAHVESGEIPSSSGKVETGRQADEIPLDMSPAFKIDMEAIDAIASAPVTVQQRNERDHSKEPVAEAGIEVRFEPPEQPEQPEAVPEVPDIEPEQEVVQHYAEQDLGSHEEAQILAAEQADAWAEAEQRASQQSKLEAEQAAMQAALNKAKALQKSSGHKQRIRLSPGKILGGLGGLTLVLIVVLPLFWPMEEFISSIGQKLSARVGQPVQIGGLKATLLPLPELKISQLAVGPNRELTAADVALRFDPFTLFASDKVIDEAELKGVVVEGAQLEQMMGWLQGLNGNAVFSLRKLMLKDVQIKAAGIALPQLKGSALFENGDFARLVLHDEADKMHVDLKSASGPLQISFGIRENTLPLLPQVQFSDFNAKGEITEGGMVLSELDAHVYNGIWSGSGSMSWRNGWQVNARINAKTMELGGMFPQYGLSGELFAEGVFSSSSASLAGLADALHLEGTFEAKRGVVNGIDMVETARLLSREHLIGGRTHFDQLNGSALLDKHILRLQQMNISSGMLEASGSVEIARDGQLSGNFNSEIKMRAGNNPLVLSGTLEEPRLQALQENAF